MSDRQNVCQDSGTTSQSRTVFPSEELQDERTKKMKHFDELQKGLFQMKNKLNEASVRCHKLNIDVATMFNPETLETLENYRDECELCLSRMSKTLYESIDVVPQAQDRLSAEENTDIE